MQAAAIQGRRWGRADAYQHTAVLAGRIAAMLPADTPAEVTEALELLTDPARLAAHREDLLAHADQPARPIPSPRPGEASRLAPLDPGHLAATLTAVEVSTLTGEALPRLGVG